MGEYDDLLYLPHPVSRKHPPMSAMDRAAQFSPFSALTGYEAVLQEAGRLTDSRAELTEYSRDMVMLDGTEISLDDVVDIQCDLFAGRV